jgi:hypothetical protein
MILWNATRQQEAGNLTWRQPGLDAALGLVVEYPFSYPRCMFITTEGRGTFTPANVSEGDTHKTDR